MYFFSFDTVTTGINVLNGSVHMCLHTEWIICTNRLPLRYNEIRRQQTQWGVHYIYNIQHTHIYRICYRKWFKLEHSIAINTSIKIKYSSNDKKNYLWKRWFYVMPFTLSWWTRSGFLNGRRQKKKKKKQRLGKNVSC